MENREQNNVIEVKNFVKDYGHDRGVFDVSFTVHKGECFGFLGPNGAGKSTTIRHLMGFSRPQKGTLTINGLSATKDRDLIMENVGYLPGEVSLPLFLTGKEFYNKQAKLRKVKDLSFAESLIERFEIDLDLRIKEMSFGMKRKLAILDAFMNEPSILILDEPTSGLDPTMQAQFRELIKEFKSRGATILLSTHMFEEVEELCDDLVIIKDGKIISSNTLDEFRNSSKFKITFKTKKDLNIFLSRCKLAKPIQNENASLITIDSKNINDIFFDLRKLDILDINEETMNLETFFISFYKEEKYE